MQQHRAAGDTVDPVADDTAAERLARVRADLVRASSQGTKLDQRRAEGTASRRQCVSCTAMMVRDHPPAGFGVERLPSGTSITPSSSAISAATTAI